MTPAAEVRQALIVATADYVDPKLQRLRAPAADAERLAGVLGDTAIGGFDVEVAVNPEERDMRRKVARFFSNRRPDDLLFLHLSCHGVKDLHGDLYLAAADTELDLLSATGVPAAWLNEQLSRTRSRRTVVLLDCCFSGSFPFGARARAGGEVNMPDQFSGDGRGLAVITASSAMEYAYEGDSLSGEGQPSFFTEAVADALATGEADRDGDQLISIQELYDYVYDRVRVKSPAQTPNMKSELEGPLYIARSVYEAPVEPASLDETIVELIRSPLAGARFGAVEELRVLLSSGEASRELAARQALEALTTDDSRRVSDRALEVLGEFPAEPAEEPEPLQEPEHPPLDTRRPKKDPPARRGGAKLVSAVSHPKGINDVVFSPDNERFATASDDKTAAVWSVDDGELIASLRHKGWSRSVTRCAFSPDGRQLATVSNSEMPEVWDLATGRSVSPKESSYRSQSIAFTRYGEQLVLSHENKAMILDVATWTPRLSLGQPNAVDQVAVSRDGTLLAIGTAREGASSANPRLIRVWDLAAEEYKYEFTSRDSSIRRLSFGPDDRYLVAVPRVPRDPDGGQLWDLSDGSSVRGKFVNSAVFTPDGRHIAGSVSGGVRFWTVPELSAEATIRQSGVVTALDVSPDGQYVAVATIQKQVQVWTVPDMS
jgi:WD40 repeat protein